MIFDSSNYDTAWAKTNKQKSTGISMPKTPLQHFTYTKSIFHIPKVRHISSRDLP